MATVTYKGVNLGSLGVIGDVRRPLPEWRPTATAVSGRDGEVFDGITLGTRECSFTFTATERTERGLQWLARDLALIFSATTPQRLMFSDEVDRSGVQLVRWAVPDGAFDFEQFLEAGRWKCKFVSYDPYLYGKSRSEIIPANSSKTINFGGNAKAYPEMSSSPSDGIYTVSTGGAHITLKGSYAGLLTLVFADQLIRTSGTCSLQTGSRFFACGGTMALHATAQTTVSWSERWM